MSPEPMDKIPLGIGNLTLDVQSRGVYRGSQRVHLTPKPFAVLEYLARNRRRIVPKDELLRVVWGEHHDYNSVEQAIRQIRKALEDDRDEPRIIQTVPGQGYCFIGAAVPPEPAPFSPPPRRAARGKWRMAAVALAPMWFLLGAILRPGLPDPKLANPVRITRSEARILSPLLTDGSTVYYQRFDNGRYVLAGVPVTGGPGVTPAAGISNPELCDMSADGRRLLVRDLLHSREDNEPVYIQPVAGGEVRRIGDILAFDAAWYPEGRRVLYAAGNGVYTADLRGMLRRRLFAVPGKAYWFRWSPDARNLRFTVIDNQTEATSLWEAAADGRGPHRLLPEFPYQQCCGSWTPGGKFFVFQVRVRNAFQIWARREGRSLFFRTNHAPVPLAVGPMNYRGPLPGKDGKKLFTRVEAPKGELLRYDRRSRQFIPLLPSLPARTAAFSRDGKWIAYTSLRDNNLWRCGSDGSGCLQLTRGMQQTALPSWSPDGKTIAFMGRRFGGKWGIFCVAASGENLTPLSADQASDADPDWSPGGRRLVFGNVLEPPEAMALHILDLRTRSVSTLPGSQGHFSPRWSPDGRFIAAIRLGSLQLDLFELASGKCTRLTRIAAGYPNWSRDGRHVYFVSTAEGRRTVFRVRVRDRVVEEVASLAAVEQGSFFMGDWIGLAPGDSPLAVRNLTTEDIYAWDFQGE
jgi:Tol biopolymer transport system component/DNA-binding winged helix-turn-helix (wHTH) protein